MTDIPAQPKLRRAVSAPVRASHALLAVAFSVAYLTGDSDFWQTVHVAMGYTVLGVIVMRVLWGLVAARSEKPSVWASRAYASATALKVTVSSWFRAPTLPVGGLEKVAQHVVNLSIVVLLLALLGASVSGYVMTLEWRMGWLEDALSETHELFSTACVVALCVHLGGVLALVFYRGSAWPMRMWHGRLAGNGPDLIKRNALWVAALMSLVTAAFWVAGIAGWVSVV